MRDIRTAGWEPVAGTDCRSVGSIRGRHGDVDRRSRCGLEYDTEIVAAKSLGKKGKEIGLLLSKSFVWENGNNGGVSCCAKYRQDNRCADQE